MTAAERLVRDKNMLFYVRMQMAANVWLGKPVKDKDEDEDEDKDEDHDQAAALAWCVIGSSLLWLPGLEKRVPWTALLEANETLTVGSLAAGAEKWATPASPGRRCRRTSACTRGECGGQGAAVECALKFQVVSLI